MAAKITDYTQRANQLKALAHPVRLHILDILRQGEICVCHVEKALGKRQAYVSQQLMVLREAGLVDSRKDGLQVYYWLANDEIGTWLNLLCGPVERDGHDLIDGCPCPHCTMIALDEIH